MRSRTRGGSRYSRPAMTTSHATPRVTGTTSSAREARLARLPALLGERILVLDGAMGTLLQRHAFTEADFRGVRFADHDRDVRGDNDLLCLTQPDAVRDGPSRLPRGRRRHRQHQLLHGDPDRAGRLRPGAPRPRDQRGGSPPGPRGRRRIGGPGRPAPVRRRLPRPHQPHGVAQPDVNDPAARNVSFEELAEAYREAAEGQVAGGADLLLLETIFDTLNAKAAIFAIHGLFEDLGFRLPLVISGTIVDASGRTLSGQTLEAFWTSIRHADPLLVGLNCALGPRQLREHVEELSRLADVALSAYPNAGLPNELGGYDETPEEMAARARRVGAGRPAQRRGLLLRLHAGAHRRHRRGRRGRSRRAPSPTRGTGHPPGRPGAAHHPDARRRLRQRRRADQRHRLAQVRAADGRCRGRGPRGRGRGRRDRPRPGRERRRDDRREHGRGDARRRRRHDPLPAPARRGARHRRRAGHGRQLQVVRHRGRAAPAPGPRASSTRSASRRARRSSCARRGCAGGTARRPW